MLYPTFLSTTHFAWVELNKILHPNYILTMHQMVQASLGSTRWQLKLQRCRTFRQETSNRSDLDWVSFRRRPSCTHWLMKNLRRTTATIRSSTKRTPSLNKCCPVSQTSNNNPFEQYVLLYAHRYATHFNVLIGINHFRLHQRVFLIVCRPQKCRRSC